MKMEKNMDLEIKQGPIIIIKKCVVIKIDVSEQ